MFLRLKSSLTRNRPRVEMRRAHSDSMQDEFDQAGY